MDVIFDIDGTTLDISHRLKYVKQSPKNWKAFRDPKEKEFDVPILPIISIAKALIKVNHQIIFASGRSEEERMDTVVSLSDYFLLDGWTEVSDRINWTSNHEHWPTLPFYMRKTGDYRKDTVVKGEMYDQMLADGYEPSMVFDDRPSVIRMWRELGDLTVIDVGQGLEF